MQNSITIAYEAVHYSRGAVKADADGSPTGFGTSQHYDRQPSPISLLGGGQLGIDGSFGAAADLYDYISKGSTFNSPLEAGLAVFQLFRSAQGLTSEGIREEGFNIIKDAIGQTAGIDVSGVANSTFPKNNGTGGSNQTTSASSSGSNSSNNATGAGATVSGAQILAQFTRQDLLDNPSALEAAAIQIYGKEYLANNQPGGVNNVTTTWNLLPDSKKQEYKNKVLA
jgi:hypothetical protein